MRDPYTIVDTAKVTEKNTMLSEKQNKYVFKVCRDATKLEIAYAIKILFKKDVLAVNTMNVRGKKKRLRTRSHGSTPAWKKAVVELKANQRIDLA